MKIEFKFDLGTRVTTDTGLVGVIRDSMIGASEEKTYYVALKTGESEWFPEESLEEFHAS